MQATISELWIYPIKGCAGIQLKQTIALKTGLEHDRCMLVVDAQSGVFLTQRSHPKMALIKPSINGQALTLSMVGQADVQLNMTAQGAAKTITVWRDTLPAIDMGDAAAAWLSAALGANVRLVRFDAQQRRAVKREPSEYYLFADGYPYLVLSKASVRALNERLIEKGESPVGVDRFRANIILDDVDAHTEDFAESLSHANGLAFNLYAPCTRCAVPNIDQRTGQSNANHEPGLTLASYRYDSKEEGVTFGINAMLNRAGELREGDTLEVAIAF